MARRSACRWCGQPVRALEGQPVFCGPGCREELVARRVEVRERLRGLAEERARLEEEWERLSPPR